MAMALKAMTWGPAERPRLSFYIQARAEALRDRIVDFQGASQGETMVI